MMVGACEKLIPLHPYLNLETAHDIAHGQSLTHRHADQASRKAITLAAVPSTACTVWWTDKKTLRLFFSHMSPDNMTLLYDATFGVQHHHHDHKTLQKVSREIVLCNAHQTCSCISRHLTDVGHNDPDVPAVENSVVRIYFRNRMCVCDPHGNGFSRRSRGYDQAD